MMYLIPTCYCQYQELSKLGANCRIEYEIGGSGGKNEAGSRGTRLVSSLSNDPTSQLPHWEKPRQAGLAGFSCLPCWLFLPTEGTHARHARPGHCTCVCTCNGLQWAKTDAFCLETEHKPTARLIYTTAPTATNMALQAA